MVVIHRVRLARYPSSLPSRSACTCHSERSLHLVFKRSHPFHPHNVTGLQSAWEYLEVSRGKPPRPQWPLRYTRISRKGRGRGSLALYFAGESPLASACANPSTPMPPENIFPRAEGQFPVVVNTALLTGVQQMLTFRPREGLFGLRAWAEDSELAELVEFQPKGTP